MKVILQEADIKKIVYNISLNIEDYLRTHHYGKIPIFTCILNGGFMFYSDLVKSLNFPIKCDFLRATSYKGSKQTDVKVTKYPESPIHNEIIFLVDDILDSGNTMKFLINEYRARGAMDVIPVTLITRKSSPKFNNHICGIEVGDEWLSGYGMDDKEFTSRNFKYIMEINR
jgi:hypoxanthine phosphoribosyltransferase